MRTDKHPLFVHELHVSPLMASEPVHRDLPEDKVWSGSSLDNWDGSKSQAHSSSTTATLGLSAHPVPHASTPSQPAPTDSPQGAGRDKLLAFYLNHNKKPTFEERAQLARETGYTTGVIASWCVV